MRKLIRSLLVVGAAAAAVLGGTAPAQAHDGHYIYVYGDGLERGRAAFLAGSLTLRVCDWTIDGKRVRAHYMTNIGNVYQSGWAPSQGCHDEGHYSNVTHWRVCAEDYGCSAWHNRY